MATSAGRVLIIAEIGVNHNGDVNLAKELIDTAKSSGADVAKFQAFVATDLASASAPLADYQAINTGNDGNQLNLLQGLELSREELVELSTYCERADIEFMASGFSIGDLHFLSKLPMRSFKIPSGEITNLPYLQTVAGFGRPIILSTGMATMEEVRSTVTALEAFGLSRKLITILHCTTDYPTKPTDVNLLALRTLRDELDVAVGYSDHTQGLHAAPIAVALGATMIEKHLTLDKNFEGPDHKASLDPLEFTKMVSLIRETEVLLGTGEKLPRESELRNSAIVRKSIVAKRPISQGELFTEENLTTKRPGTGISPMLWPTILGIPAPRNFQLDELIEL